APAWRRRSLAGGAPVRGPSGDGRVGGVDRGAEEHAFDGLLPRGRPCLLGWARAVRGPGFGRPRAGAAGLLRSDPNVSGGDVAVPFGAFEQERDGDIAGC